jgi:hypothetical protein
MIRLSLAVLVLIGWLNPARPDDASANGKKLIEWGWDESDTKFMRANIGQMEQLPFDGLVFHVNSSKGGGLTWEMWGSRKFTLDEFKQALDDLMATKFRRFTDRFLRVNVAPGKVDWFDDEAWATVLNNCGVAAQVAREGRCKGFMFDVEQYEGKLFDYRQQKHQASKTFAEYQQKVRQRGKQWMQAINKKFPDITMLLTFGYSIAQPRRQARDRSQVSYGLLADFLDGMLDACSKETTIVDAWESAYPYKELRQFEQAYQTIKKKALDWTAVPDKYRSQVKAGFGLWMDNNWRRKGWNVTDFSKNHFTPAEFASAVHSGLRASDQYVWIYTEQPRWWTKEKLPQAYVDALASARKGVKHSLQTPMKKRPLLAVWMDSGPLGDESPYLRLAIWEDGTVVLAKDAKTWNHDLRLGTIPQERVKELKHKISGTGVFGLKGYCYLVPDAPVICLVASFGDEKQILYWDEVEQPHYGINVDPKPHHLAFIKAWKAVNKAGISYLPDKHEELGEGFVKPPAQWFVKRAIQSD